ncbi:AraC family transcriptional regulator [Cohnella sp. WQ 127256]|uniref:helix-turn-helix transcriptional regulator n=1 Tax=Cohnella sp. WQ 127256 TaxID=2938790 RepID=UPI0021180932|nr:AraC family transcriptional regulator [Cohnella sp. WQ 127256]
MKLSTIGRMHQSGYTHPMWVSSEEMTNFNEGRHERYRLLLSLDGTGVCEIEGASYPIHSPAFYCLNERDSFHLLPGSYMKAKSVFFHPNLINDLFSFELTQETFVTFSERDKQDMWYLDPFRDRLVNTNSNQPIIVPIDPALANYGNHLIEEVERQLVNQPDSKWPCRSRSILIEILALLRRAYGEMKPTVQPIPSAASEKIHPVILHLHTNYKNKIKIEDLTKLFHTNKTTLNQNFKLSTGLSIMSYLNSIRMQMASDLLRNTLLPSEEIMVRVGLRDNAHFIRTFRKHSGCSPAEFRNLYCRMPQPM